MSNSGISRTKNQVEPENKNPPKFEEDETKEYEGDVHIGINTEEMDSNRMMEIKPREEYLQKKIDEMNFDDNVMNGVTRGLGLSLDFIRNDLDDDKILITEVTNDNLIKKYVDENEEKEKIHKTDEQNIISKKHLKKLRDYREEKEFLNKKIKMLESKKKFIESEGMMNIDEVEQNIKNNELRKIKKDTSFLNTRINEIDYQIKNIIAEEYSMTRKEKINLFLSNFEKEKEKSELQTKKYYKKFREKRNQIKQLEKEMKLNSEKELEKIEENKKKEQELILENAKKIIEKERETREKMKKKNEEKEKERIEKLEKHNEEKTEEQKEIEKKFINKKQNECIYFRNPKIYLQNEEDYLKAELEKIKEAHPIISLKEIKEFKTEKVKNYNKNKLDIDEKYNKIKKDWIKNKNDLPKFKNHLFKEAEERTKQLEEEEKKKNELISERAHAKKKYGESVQDRKPEISEKKKKEREDNIKKLTEKILVKDTIYNYKKKRILLVKRDPNKPSKFNWELKLDDIDEKDVEINKALIKKPKINILSSSLEKNKRESSTKKSDDLQKDLIKKRNHTEINSDNEISVKKENLKWEKMIKNKNGSIKQNIQNVKIKAEHLEQLANEKEKILKVNGGIEKNPELGQKVSDLLIDSIHAKLSILNSIGDN